MWQFKHFQELDAQDFHQIIKERTKIFVVEQGCAYQEVDDIDLRAIHVVKRQKNSIKAYARIYKEDHKMKIGRVLVPEEYRNEGHGKELIKVALDYVKCHHPNSEVSIQAEAYLKDFYEKFGFETTSDLYYDYAIGHYDMKLIRKEIVLQQ
ncbi:GNAT family N-acetyltransferase [Alkalibacterium sp. f15]|uniref:GNAT family N-acetyltransferase n=1 Tax=Alkalibacterium sp. f15 TaxID=3414029 RepID=UPI003BF790F6